MSFSTLARNKSSERLIALVSAVAVMLGMMAVYAPPALAHHPELVANQTCVDREVVVEYTSTSWLTTGASGSAHADIRIQARPMGGNWVEVGSGAYTAANGYSFDGTFDGSDLGGQAFWNTTIEVRAQALGPWQNGMGGNEYSDTVQVNVTQDCFNPSCPAQYLEYKLEPVSSGTHGPNDEFTIEVDSTAGGQVFDWTSTVPVFQVIVKGGPGANVYDYSGAFGDSGLHAPVNPSNGSFYGLSHISFCYQQSQDDPVEVSVTPGVCAVTQGQPGAAVEVTIDPNSGATVSFTNGTSTIDVTTSGAVILGPGSWSWTATAADGFQLSGPSSGQFTIDDCDTTVSIAASAVCTLDNSGAAVGSVEIVIDPTSGAVVTVYSDAAMTQEVFDTGSTGTFDLAPGTYYWEADAADGFDIDGASSGQFTIDPCEVSVDVSGTCVLDGDQGTGEIAVTISVDGGATVVITDGGGAPVATLTETDTITVPEGAGYSWTATASAGFTISGDDSGSVDIDECTRSIDVVVNGVCEADVPIITWEVTPVNFSATEVTITWNDLDPSDPLHSSVEPLSGSMVWPGTVVEDGVAVDWAGWLLVDGVWVQGSDGYENTLPSASLSFEVNPTMTVDVPYPGGEPTCDGPPGEIIVEKAVVGDVGGVEFDFVTNGFDLADSSLAHGESSSSGPVLPGSGYSVAESGLPAGWEQVNAVCDNGSDPSNITVGVGEVVTCTFTNGIADSVMASIQVTVSGSCELDGDEGEGLVDISMSVPNGATVVVRDSDGDVVGTLTDDGTLSVPEGATYTWEATPSEGFEFPPGFDSSGTFTIERCSDPETLPFTGFDPYEMGMYAILLMGAGITAMFLAPKEEGA